MDVLVMENLLFKRNFARLYDLKGSTRARYNPDTSGSNTVLLDQNLVEAMPTSPIFVGSKAKRLLERAVWNDTSFLASIHVMDYSLLIGVDEERSELVLGTIDFMRQTSGDLGQNFRAAWRTQELNSHSDITAAIQETFQESNDSLFSHGSGPMVTCRGCAKQQFFSSRCEG
ncbi:hypothetical protein Rs2_05091 [Raphanus sativus]|nr:hypothetical protein Rs2_05091 [Raphanus sativus]